ncbi:FAD:protein FMN transferase [Celeribacter sp.]|uniref:FAD:protein FMN transferase n=1 Tax=Celeribacter sp. TaxID=1890673 RepID=UPI003A8D5C4E
MSDSFLLSRRSFMVMPICLAACKKGWSVLELTGLTMGTSYSIVAVDHTKDVNKAEVQKAVDLALAEVNTQMSNWDASSEISRFNAASAGDSLTVSPELEHVMLAAGHVHDATEGRFDVTVGSLIDLWGFGANGTRMDAPSDAQIADAMARSGQSRSLKVENGTLTKMNDGAEVYLSAIGKGFGVDQVARTLKSFGITDYMVEIGGDLYTAGRNPEGKAWQIGIETPEAFDRGVAQVVGVSDMGMATSGDYRNFFEVDGQRYSHIIDATTGRPVTHNTASVTVMTENAMLADAWATALLVLGRERGLEIANQRDLAVLFIDHVVQDGEHGRVSYASDKFTALTA